MNSSYLNHIANQGATLLTKIGLKDASGNELSGGNPAYARQSVTWTQAVDGVIRPTGDISFNIPAGKTVASWFVADNADTVHGSGTLTQETFNNQGEYVLLAATSGITHVTGV